MCSPDLSFNLVTVIISSSSKPPSSAIPTTIAPCFNIKKPFQKPVVKKRFSNTISFRRNSFYNAIYLLPLENQEHPFPQFSLPTPPHSRKLISSRHKEFGETTNQFAQTISTVSILFFSKLPPGGGGGCGG
jgi:hypothetical protein